MPIALLRRLALPALLLLVTAPVPVQAQDTDEEWLEHCWRHHHNDDREVYCEVREVEMQKPARLVVDGGRNAPVGIHGESRSDIEASVRIQVHARRGEDARAMAREIRILTDGGRLRAEGPGSGSWTAGFRVRVPRALDIEARTQNGPLSVRDVEGRMELEVRNGPLALRDLAGDVRARAENGPLSIALAGDRWRGAGLDAETRNGPLTLKIPEGYSAELEAGTINGPMTVDFPLTVTIQGRVQRRFTTTLGSGGARVRAVTTNGPMAITRR